MGAVRRVYLLGAGFSRAISESVAAFQKMPVLTELTKAVKSVLGGRLDFAGAEGPLANDFERWMSYLVDSPPWLTDDEQMSNHAAFMQLYEAVYQVLTDRQIYTVERPHPDWLQRLVRHWEDERATVITVNYDVLVELAWLLWANDYHNVSTDLYGVPIVPLETRLGGVPATQTRGTRTAVSLPRMKLLKLHGSLNWWYPGPSGNPGDVVYDAGLEGQAWSRLGIRPFQQMRYEVSISDRKPLIVPPAAVKSAYYGNRIIRTVWQLAGTELGSAAELTIMGFSLPITDMMISSMLSTRLHADAKITPVDIGEKAAIVKRISDTFGIDKTDQRICTDFVGIDAPIPTWVEVHTHQAAEG